METNKHIEEMADILWCNGLSNEEKKKLTLIFSRHVLPIFEEKYPEDNRPRRAIEVAEDESSSFDDKWEAGMLANWSSSYAASCGDSYKEAAYAAYAASFANSGSGIVVNFCALAAGSLENEEREFQLTQMLNLIKERK